MLLRITEVTGLATEAERTLYLREDVIAYLSHRKSPYVSGEMIYQIHLITGAILEVTKESYDKLLSILGWIDPADLEKTETVVRGSLDLLSQPSTSEPKRKKKIRGSGSE